MLHAASRSPVVASATTVAPTRMPGLLMVYPSANAGCQGDRPDAMPHAS
jgi:hypothetical protein